MRRGIPYAVAGSLLIDPDTMQHLALIKCELTEDDVNSFFDLAHRSIPRGLAERSHPGRSDGAAVRAADGTVAVDRDQG